MIHENQTIYKRNKLLITLLITGFSLDLLSNILGHSSPKFIITVSLFGGVSLGLSVFLHIKRIYPKFVMFFLIIMSWLTIATVCYVEPDMVNMVFLFLLPVAAGLYPSKSLIITATVLSISTFSFFALAHEKIMGPNFFETDLIYYGSCVLIIGIAGVSQQRFNERLRKQVETKAEEATASKEQALSSMDKMKENGRALAEFSGKLESIVVETANQTSQVSSGFQEMNKALSEQNDSLTNLVVNVSSVSEKTDEINDSSFMMKTNSEESLHTIQETVQEVLQLKEEMELLVHAFKDSLTLNIELSHKTSEISQIMDVLESINGQINLLALNAAIEAARAGEHGRGFAVVSDEIRKLADKTSNSMKGIGHILVDIDDKTKLSVQKMEQSKQLVDNSKTISEKVGEAFDVIASNTENVHGQTKSVNEHITLLRDSLKEINVNISRLSAVSEENESSVNNLSVNVKEMEHMIQQINQDFKTLQEKTNSI